MCRGPVGELEHDHPSGVGRTFEDVERVVDDEALDEADEQNVASATTLCAPSEQARRLLDGMVRLSATSRGAETC